MNDTGRREQRARRSYLVGLVALAALALAVAAPAAVTSSTQAKCGICGKNLIKNPGAELGRGVMAVGAFGAVPGWTLEGGQFGAASYAFRNGWFSAKTKGPASRGKNYFFGGTTEAAIRGPASIGAQTIALPSSTAGRRAILSGWLGNYGNSRAQVRAQFLDVTGTVLSTIRIGPVVTTGSSDMVLRSRSATVPASTTQVEVSVNFGPNAARYNLAGADNLSLVVR